MSRSSPGRSMFEDHWNATFWLLFLIVAAMFIIQVLINSITPEILAGLLIILIGVYVMGAEFKSRRVSKVMDENSRKLNDLNQWANKSYDYTRGFKEKHENLIFNTNLRIAESEEKAKGEREMIAKKLLDMENTLNKFLRSIRDRKAIEESYNLVKPVLEKEATTRTDRPQALNMDSRPPVVREIESLPIIRPERKAPEIRSLPESPRPPIPERPTRAPDRLSDLNLRQSSSIDTIRRKGQITNKEYADMFKLTNKTAYRDLNKMVSLGLLKRAGKGRNTHYTLAF